MLEMSCAAWCNVWTCAKRECTACTTCLPSNATRPFNSTKPLRCAAWCNQWTCRMADCSDCAAHALNGCGATRAPIDVAWGCCADKAAKRCGECRWAAGGGFCSAHKVNCQKCGFALFCPPPEAVPPPAPPAPPPSPAPDFRASRDGTIQLCGDGAGGAGGGCRPFLFKGLSWFGMEEKYAQLQGLERQPLAFFLDLVAAEGFNALRLPLAVTNVLQDPKPTTVRHGPRCCVHGGAAQLADPHSPRLSLA